MCESCVQIDKKVEQYRELLRSTTEQAEIERINRLIAGLYADRVRLHQNPQKWTASVGGLTAEIYRPDSERR
jgi:hypothetical protein